MRDSVLDGLNVTSHLDAQACTLARSELSFSAASFNGVFYNEIQTCIISKEPDTSINVFDNVVKIYQKEQGS